MLRCFTSTQFRKMHSVKRKRMKHICVCLHMLSVICAVSDAPSCVQFKTVSTIEVCVYVGRSETKLKCFVATPVTTFQFRSHFYLCLQIHQTTMIYQANSPLASANLRSPSILLVNNKQIIGLAQISGGRISSAACLINLKEIVESGNLSTS